MRCRFSCTQRVQRDGAVFVQRVAFAIDRFRVGRDRLAGDRADDLERAAVIVDRVGRVQRRVIGVAVFRVQFLQTGDLLQVDVIEQELDVLVVEKKVRHG